MSKEIKCVLVTDLNTVHTIHGTYSESPTPTYTLDRYTKEVKGNLVAIKTINGWEGIETELQWKIVANDILKNIRLTEHRERKYDV